MHRVVSRDKWLAERQKLLLEEKEFTRRRDALGEQRRALPWVLVEKRYEFDSPQGRVTLADLFRDRSQLFVQHVMQGPGQPLQCVGCALGVDHLESILPHLENPTHDNLLRNGQTIEGVDEDQAWDIVLRPGEMSLHHGDIIHGSNANRSSRERIGFIVRFVTPEVERASHPLIQVRGTASCPHLELMSAPPFA